MLKPFHLQYFITLLFCLQLLRVFPQTTHYPDVIKVDGGTISGLNNSTADIHSYKGIPFAAPPVGELRWKAPQPVIPWEGIRNASEYGARCMQGNIYSDMIFHDAGPSE